MRKILRRLTARHATPHTAADIGGWTAPAYTTADTGTFALMHQSQPGSRLYYVDNVAGTNPTPVSWAGTGTRDNGAGEVYFWNGTNIVDSSGATTNTAGVAFGTDPRLPNLAAIKPFASWQFVGPRRAGGEPGTASAEIGSSQFTPSVGRVDKPDVWLFKRGTTIDLKTDLGTTEFDTSGLALPGAATGKQMMLAYGPLTTAPPKFIHPGAQGYALRSCVVGAGNVQYRNVLYQSLWMDGHDRPAGTTDANYIWQVIYNATGATGILYEDVCSDGLFKFIPSNGGGTDDPRGSWSFRRCRFFDFFSTAAGQVQAIYQLTGQDAAYRIEDGIFARNGYHVDPSVTWPPASQDGFSRAWYLNGHCDHMNCYVGNNVVLASGSGAQLRSGPVAEKNFFYEGYTAFGAKGGDAYSQSGRYDDNVLQIYQGTAGSGQPFWGFSHQSSAKNAPARRNITTDAQNPTVPIDGTFIGFGSIVPSQGDGFVNATTGCSVDDGIIVARTGGTGAYGVADGVNYGPATDNGNGTVSFTNTQTSAAETYTYPGVTGNTTARNKLVGISSGTQVYTGSKGAAAPSPAGSDLNTYGSPAADRFYATVATAISTEGWAADSCSRTLKTYLQSLGITVSTADGVVEYVALARQMWRGQYRQDLTASKINNHFRAGFGLPLL